MKKSICLASVAALALSTPALAQEDSLPTPADTADRTAEDSGAAPASGGLEEIVVTAQKRAENVQDVPIAISAFTSSALQERAVTDIAQLSNIAPNVTLDAGTPFSGSAAVLSAYIRGIGANDFAFNIDPGVGVYLDGVYLARSVGANQDLADVERIEVLKGPQGTLFGRNTIGGAISIVTHDPGEEFRFVGDVTTGSYNLIQARGTVDLPIAPGLSSSVSFSVKDRKGYVKRIRFPGVTDLNNPAFSDFRAAGYEGAGLGREGSDESWSGRAKLVWDNGGPLRVVLSGDYSSIDQEQLANSLIKTVPNVFAATYNCALEGQIIFDGPATCGGQSFQYVGPPTPAAIAGIAGLNTPFDLPSFFGVNADADPTNDRVPYDDRFLTGDIDRSYATGNNFSQLETYGGAATLSFDLSDSLQVKSITGYRELHWDVGMDLDGSPLNFLHTSFNMNQWQFSQELQLLGSALNNSLNYVLGAYYFKEKGDLHDFVTFAEGLLQVDGPNDLATKNYAFFGQVDWRVSQLIGITLGGRYTHEDKTFEGFQSDRNALNYKIVNFLALAGTPGLEPCANINPISDQCRIIAGFPNPGEPLRYYVAGTQKKKFNNFSPKASIQIHPNDDVMVYGTWSRGYKTGGWTTRLSNPLAFAPDFDEEKAETFEVGVKSQFLNRMLQINAAAFTTSYKGIQLNFQQGVSPTIQNAGNARIKGFEIEALARPLAALTINASVGYLDATYTSVDAGAQVPFDPDPIFGRYGVFEGATLPKTPKWKFNVSPRYEIRLGNGGSIVLIADYTHSTKLKNDTEGYFLLMRPATDLLNASVQYVAPNERWNVTVGGTNITDERYLVTGQAQFAGGAAYGTYSRPAEWYARLGVKF
jgi:iron complex outermembrane receptor protein